MEKVLIFDGNDEKRPAICFNLELSRFKSLVVNDTDEVVNLLGNSVHTDENYLALVVNNPYFIADLTNMVQKVRNAGMPIPIIFTKAANHFGETATQHFAGENSGQIFSVEPTGLVELLTLLKRQKNDGLADRTNAAQ